MIFYVLHIPLVAAIGTWLLIALLRARRLERDAIRLREYWQLARDSERRLQASLDAEREGRDVLRATCESWRKACVAAMGALKVEANRARHALQAMGDAILDRDCAQRVAQGATHARNIAQDERDAVQCQLDRANATIKEQIDTISYLREHVNDLAAALAAEREIAAGAKPTPWATIRNDIPRKAAAPKRSHHRKGSK